MSRIDKLLAKLERARSDISIRELGWVLEYYGYAHSRTRGSHFYFTQTNRPEIRVPVHNGKTRRWYAQDAIKQIRKDL